MNDTTTTTTTEEMRVELRQVGAMLGLLTQIDWAIADRKNIQDVVHSLTVELSGQANYLETRIRQAATNR